MAVSSFALGFLVALVCVVGFIAAALSYLKWSQSKKAPVRGYLDLIPDLSTAQRQRVQEIRETFLPKVQEIRNSLQSERAELARLLFEEPADRDRIFAVARKILLHQSDLETEVIEHILEEQELLTPSQKRRFHSIVLEQFASGGLGVHDVRGK